MEGAGNPIVISDDGDDEDEDHVPANNGTNNHPNTKSSRHAPAGINTRSQIPTHSTVPVTQANTGYSSDANTFGFQQIDTHRQGQNIHGFNSAQARQGQDQNTYGFNAPQSGQGQGQNIYGFNVPQPVHGPNAPRSQYSSNPFAHGLPQSTRVQPPGPPPALAPANQQPVQSNIRYPIPTPSPHYSPSAFNAPNQRVPQPLPPGVNPHIQAITVTGNWSHPDMAPYLGNKNMKESFDKQMRQIQNIRAAGQLPPHCQALLQEIRDLDVNSQSNGLRGSGQGNADAFNRIKLRTNIQNRLSAAGSGPATSTNAATPSASMPKKQEREMMKATVDAKGYLHRACELRNAHPDLLRIGNWQLSRVLWSHLTSKDASVSATGNRYIDFGFMSPFAAGVSLVRDYWRFTGQAASPSVANTPPVNNPLGLAAPPVGNQIAPQVPSMRLMAPPPPRSGNFAPAFNLGTGQSVAANMRGRPNTNVPGPTSSAYTSKVGLGRGKRGRDESEENKVGRNAPARGEQDGPSPPKRPRFDPNASSARPTGPARPKPGSASAMPTEGARMVQDSVTSNPHRSAHIPGFHNAGNYHLDPSGLTNFNNGLRALSSGIKLPDANLRESSQTSQRTEMPNINPQQSASQSNITPGPESEHTISAPPSQSKNTKSILPAELDASISNILADLDAEMGNTSADKGHVTQAEREQFVKELEDLEQPALQAESEQVLVDLTDDEPASPQAEKERIVSDLTVPKDSEIDARTVGDTDGQAPQQEETAQDEFGVEETDGDKGSVENTEQTSAPQEEPDRNAPQNANLSGDERNEQALEPIDQFTAMLDVPPGVPSLDFLVWKDPHYDQTILAEYGLDDHVYDYEQFTWVSRVPDTSGLDAGQD